MLNPWRGIALLAAEAQYVVWLRILKLSAGGAEAPAEAWRMLSEKMTVASQAAAGAMMGESPAKSVNRYRRAVRANRRRLSKQMSG